MALSNSKVVFDTNMLLAITQFKTDVVGQVKELLGQNAKLFVTGNVMKELEVIASERIKQEKDIKIIKEILEKNGVNTVEVAGNTDDGLLELAGRDFLVATNDKALRKRIKSIGRKIIYLRKKKLIELE